MRKIARLNSILAFFIILLLVAISGEKGNFVYSAAKIIKEKKKQGKWDVILNTPDSFKQVKKLNAYVFMVGNDAYAPESGFSPLKQCFNDAKLLARLLMYCSKVDKERIFTYGDMTLDLFRSRFKEFIEFVKKDDPEGERLVIITYSGHGDEDGSLVMVKGEHLKPDELKSMVNSFPQDTILILDACYSGSNEGPKEAISVKKEKKEGFKSSSIRIYASLAHLTAKEIKYSSEFFAKVLPFYKKVLKLDNIEGNGYFTAMIGYFFAEYKVKEGENILFKDLVSYITNKGKQYVEYLSLKQSTTQRFEATTRLNQQPKILPLQESPDFVDVNHNYILITNPIVPIGLDVGLSMGVFLPVGTFGSNFSSPAIYGSIFVGYELDFLLKSLFVSVSNGILLIDAKQFNNRRNVSAMMIMPMAGVYYRFFRKSFFNLIVGAEAGITITLAQGSSLGPLKEVNETYYNTSFATLVACNFKIFRDFDITLRSQFLFIGYSQEPLFGLAFSAGAQYFF